MAKPTPVQQLEVKPFPRSELHDRGRREHEYHRAADLGQVNHGPLGDGTDLPFRAIAQIPILEFGKRHAEVLPPPGHAKARDREY